MSLFLFFCLPLALYVHVHVLCCVTPMPLLYRLIYDWAFRLYPADISPLVHLPFVIVVAVFGPAGLCPERFDRCVHVAR